MADPTKEALDVYLDVVKRLEPNLTHTDQDATITSIAISLKRIADILDQLWTAKLRGDI